MMPTTTNGALNRNKMPLLNPLASFCPSGELSRAVLHIAHWAERILEAASKGSVAAIANKIGLAQRILIAYPWRSMERQRQDPNAIK
jgi:hypothetical protein